MNMETVSELRDTVLTLLKSETESNISERHHSFALAIAV